MNTRTRKMNIPQKVNELKVKALKEIKKRLTDEDPLIRLEAAHRILILDNVMSANSLKVQSATI